MRVFLAGATGVLGVRLVPLLVTSGHVVAGLTRSPAKRGVLRELGAQAVVCDVYDAAALCDAVVDFGPELILHELTDLPDDPTRIGDGGANARMRREGTRNLIDAAQAAGAHRFVAQSVAWELQGEGAAAKAELERLVLGAGGVVLRYGRLHGPGTHHASDVPPPPRIHVDEAAERTVALLESPSTIVDVVSAETDD
jgi:nucleoside-diphosphate-sugar epimerase